MTDKSQSKKISRLPPLQSSLFRGIPSQQLPEPENHLQGALSLTLRILDRYKREGRSLGDQESMLLEQIKSHPCCAPECFGEATLPLERAANNPNLSPRTQQLIKKLQSAVGAHKMYRDSLVRKSDVDSIISFTHSVMEAAPTLEGLAEPLLQQLKATVVPDVGNRFERQNTQAEIAVYFFSDDESYLFDPIEKIRIDDLSSPVMRCALSLQQAVCEHAAYFPVRSPNACFGAVSVTNLVEPLSSTQLELVATAVSIAALYLNRQRLLDSLQWQVEKAEAMLTMAMRLSCENLDSQVLVEGIMSTARTLTDSERCKVFLVHGDTISYFDNGRSVKVATMEAGVAGHVAKTGLTVNIRDAARDKLSSTWGDVERGDTGNCIHTMLCMPVYYEKTMVAVAQLINKLDTADPVGGVVKRHFSSRDEELFTTFALFVGVCLRNCRINEHLLEEKRKSEAILDVVTLLSNTDIRDVNAILGHVMLGARKLLSADRASLFLLDKERNELFSKVADSTGGREIRFPSGKGIAGTVATSGIAENITDAYTDSRFNREIDKQFGYRTLSILCEPIAVNGEVLAVAQLVNKTQPDGTVTAFSADDQSTFRTFALFAGISIANSHLLEFAVRAGNEAMALTAMIDASSSAQNTPRRSSMSPIGTPIIAPVLPFELESVESVEIGQQEEIASKDFDIFAFIDAHQPKASDAATALIQRLILSTGLPEQFKCSAAALSNFVIQCRRRYRRVPYHNFLHVVDVCQTIHTFLYEGGVKNYLTDLECFVLLITALVHDLDHMGLNNSFHLKTDSPLGILSSSSGNNSVLEVHHCNLAIEILSDDAANVFKGLSPAEVTYAFRCLIDCVLATDMARHEELLRNFSVVWVEGFDKKNEYHRRLLMQMILKAGDISNVTKPFDISHHWAVAVTEEFYQQGDKEKEKGVVVLPMFDRALNTELARGQIGFINFVAKKFYNLLSDALPSLKWTSERILENMDKWASM